MNRYKIEIPLIESYGNCLDDALVSILIFFKKQYPLLFVKDIGFRFDLNKYKTTKSLTDNLIIEHGNRKKIVYEYFGIEFKVRTFSNEEHNDFFEAIGSEIKNNRPVLLEMAKDSNLKKVYEKLAMFDYQTTYYSNHIIIVNGIDFLKKQILICDSFFKYKDIQLSFADFIPVEKASMITMRLKNQNLRNTEILKNSIQKYYSDNNDFNVFKNIKNMKSALKTYDPKMLKNEFKVEDNVILQAPLINKIYEICKSKKKFSSIVSLLFFCQDENKVIEITNDIEYVSVQWNIILSMFTKMYYSRSKSGEYKNRILIKLKLIEEIERNIFKKINQLNIKRRASKLYSNKNDISDRLFYFSNNIEQSEIISVLITEHLNNSGVRSKSNPKKKVDFNGLGDYIIDDNLLGSMLSKNEYKFFIDDSNDLGYDNISCSNNNILVKQEHYTFIQLLGCSEYGRYMEKLKITYIDGTEQEIKFCFSEWDFGAYDENEVVWRGYGYKKIGNIYEMPVRLYAKRFPLLNKKVNSIMLPDCPNIHIFGVSLEKPVKKKIDLGDS